MSPRCHPYQGHVIMWYFQYDVFSWCLPFDSVYVDEKISPHHFVACWNIIQNLCDSNMLIFKTYLESYVHPGTTPFQKKNAIYKVLLISWVRYKWVKMIYCGLSKYICNSLSCDNLYKPFTAWNMYRWFIARLQYLHCDTAVLRKADIDIWNIRLLLLWNLM